MSTSLIEPDKEYALSPEALEVTDIYLRTLDATKTAKELGIAESQVMQFLEKKEVKRFLDTVFLERGYANRFKLQSLLDTIITSKLEEAEETQIYSSKDLVDILKLQHDIIKEQVKLREQGISRQTNVQVNNYGENLSSLLQQLTNME